MTRTVIDIPDELLTEARAALGGNISKAEAVRRALAEIVRQHRQLEAIEWFSTTDALADLRDPAVRAAARR